MIYSDDDYISLAGIQHFTFCRRQWALIYVECVWDVNNFTVSGTLLHERAHDPLIVEKRGDLIVSRNMHVQSRVMGITGRCDVVEFYRDASGVTIYGREGRWLPCPVEYKRGHTKKNDADRLQLCAETMCLEEMLGCQPINEAYLYYDEIKRREKVVLDASLRENVYNTYKEMHEYISRGFTPRVKRQKSCSSCSLANICLPELPFADNSVSTYIEEVIMKNII